ncbi:MFS transporter [Halalkalicoccus salilacus]|uniref:MFS transporter n=1 Tax=Halalkalicoccus salilacus TaxID=3117459 RepID=UPI00300F7ADF
MATRLGRLTRFDALAVTAAIWFLAKLLRYAFPPLFEQLRATYGVSNAVVGGAFTGLMLVYAAMQFPSGVLADRFGSVRVIVAGALLAALGALVLVVESPFPVLVCAMLVIGAGTGAHKTVAVRLLSGIYPRRTGRVLGALDTFGTFGGVAAPLAVVAFVGTGTAGWRGFFLVAGLVGIVLAGLFVRRVPRRIPDDRSGADEGPPPIGTREYLAPFGDGRFVLFVAVTVAFSFAYNGVVAFLPLYLVEEAGLPGALASLLYSALFAASVVQLATGELSDRVGRPPVLAASVVLGLIGILLLASFSTPIALGVGVVVFGLGYHGFRPVRGAYLVEIVSDSIVGGTLGSVRTVHMGVGALAPAVVGLLADLAGFRVAFGTLAGSVGLSLVCTALLFGGDGDQ